MAATPPVAAPAAVPISFDGVLTEVLDRNEAFNPLAHALAIAREKVGAATNMGVSGDDRDLFHLIDDLSTSVVATYPESLCYAGCGRCCHYPTAFFDIFPQEWTLIREHLEQHWAPARREALVALFWKSHGPYLWLIRAFEWLMGLAIPLFPTHKALPLQCPFLEDDRWSIYRVRPFPCRAFGAFQAKMTRWSRSHVYACSEQSEALTEAIAKSPLNPALPDIHPVQLKQYAFVDGRRRTIASWIARTYPQPKSWSALAKRLRTTVWTCFNWW